MVKFDPLQIEPIGAKGVEIAVLLCPPADEFYPQFVSRLGGPDKVFFLDPEMIVELANWRYRSFADAHSSDHFRLDQSDRYARPPAKF